MVDEAGRSRRPSYIVIDASAIAGMINDEAAATRLVLPLPDALEDTGISCLPSRLVMAHGLASGVGGIPLMAGYFRIDIIDYLEKLFMPSHDGAKCMAKYFVDKLVS